MKFLIGSSYFDGGMAHRKEFSRVWHFNTLQAKPEPSRIVVIVEGGAEIPIHSPNMDLIRLTGDLGNFMTLHHKQKPHSFTGWTASMVALAMIAYIDESDFIYKEQDCLAFGPCIERMYSDLGDGDIVFGAAHNSAPWMTSSQSLFMIRHGFITEFICKYLGYGHEGDLNNLGEHRFTRMLNELGPERVKTLSFGVDRERPLPFDAPVWYGQKFTDEELNEMHRRQLI